MTTPDASRPLVSVVMPVRNEAASVEAAVRSVLEQSVQDLEVLVVDGSSTDDTVARVSSLVDREPRVRLLHNPDGTIPHALNTGLGAARGRFIARVDAHASVNDTYLQRGIAALLSSPDVAAVGGLRIGVAQTPTGRAVAAALSSPFGVGGSINHYASAPTDTDHASFGVYRREVLEAVHGWDERLLVNEDVDIDHRILALGHRIRFDPEMRISWHVRESLGDFARQYRRYGRGKAGMVRKNGLPAVRGRHLAAPALVTSLLCGAVLASTGRRRPLLAVAVPYAGGVVAATARTARLVERTGERPPPPRALAGAFVTMHLSWGLGFLEGLVLGRQPASASAR